MADMGIWEDAEPGVRRRILQAKGALMLMEVQFARGAGDAGSGLPTPCSNGLGGPGPLKLESCTV